MRNNKRLMNRVVSIYEMVYFRANMNGRWLTFPYYFLVIILCVVIVGCASTKEPASVVDKALNETTVRSTNDGTSQKEGDYIVQRRDTLYSIAVKYGIPLSELAKWNNISDPNSIEPGQKISLSIPSTKQAQPSVFPLGQPVISGIESNLGGVSQPAAIDGQIKREPKGLKLQYSGQTLAEMQYMANMPTTMPSTNQRVADNKVARIEVAPVPESTARLSLQNNAKIEWMWPAPGKLIEGFSKDSKGVRISGQSGQAVLASAAGEVVYSGSGLRGYGKLIIIKHNNTFLSAYAYNSLLLVKEGDRVAKGQKIAEMGNTDTDTVKLHFEIREQGKPVDPLRYLPSRAG